MHALEEKVVHGSRFDRHMRRYGIMYLLETILFLPRIVIVQISKIGVASNTNAGIVITSGPTCRRTGLIRSPFNTPH